MIAALYVQTGGCYFGLPNVDPWDEARDARSYAGPWPVVAHPPCERWGRYWGGGPSAKVKRAKGDDGGCFAAALASVRRWGGVLEHPADSSAWAAHGLRAPLAEGWHAADLTGGWTCRVEQGAYGHPARKATWLYAHGVELPSLRWGRALGDFRRLDPGFHTAAERAAAPDARRTARRLTKSECVATPPEFRDLLISIAEIASRIKTRVA